MSDGTGAGQRGRNTPAGWQATEVFFAGMHLAMAGHPPGRRRRIWVAVLLAAPWISLAHLPEASTAAAVPASRPQPVAPAGPQVAAAIGVTSRGRPSTSSSSSTAAPTPSPPLARLPCPLEAGWEALLTLRLPRLDVSGRPSGGFSAVAYDPSTDLLELLSDSPQGFVQRWSGLRHLVAAAQRGRAEAAQTLEPRDGLVLRSGDAQLPREMDGEGLVRVGSDLWVASEGRRSASRPAQLLRFEAASGALRQALELPTAWQPAPGRGLEANKGPESLALWRQASGADTLLMASETALLQDPAGQARLLEWQLSASGATARPLRSLALPGGGVWSLTELLVVPQPHGAAGLLALLRRFEEPDRWGARLVLYPSPARTATASEFGATPAPAAAQSPANGEANRTSPMAPIHSWTLLANGPGNPGLPPDNWEGLSWGPTLADGRATLVLISDDNFSPFQANWLAVLAPRRLASCRATHS